MDWTEILKDVGIVGVISGLITWLIKQLGESYLTKNAKIHQQKLNNQTEQFKLELNQTFEKYKSEIEFLSQKANKLHDKRIERIENIYTLLTDFFEDMQVLASWKIVAGMSKEEIETQSFENVKKAEKTGNEFLNYYSRNKLYFNSETCDLIDEIITLLKESHANFSFKYIFGTMSAEFEIEQIKEATEKIRKKVPKLKEELEENFRNIIGVNN